MTNFDWQKSQLNEYAQCCVKRYNSKQYRLAVSETLRKGEFQAMCNAVRVTKDLFPTLTEAKTACEKWFRREVLGEEWNAEDALAGYMDEKGFNDSEIARPSLNEMARLLVEKFKVEPR